MVEREPYGAWTILAHAVPAGWTNGTDPRSGNIYANDLAVLIVAKNSNGTFIGDRVGWLGYAWNDYGFAKSSFSTYSAAASTVLGYSGGLDAGNIMQRTDGPSFAASFSGVNASITASNLMTLGAPIILNLSTSKPVFGPNQPAVSQADMVVVGVLSGSNVAAGEIYSSAFGNNAQYPGIDSTYGNGNIGALMRTVCEMTAPQGGTFKSRGYCDP